MTPDEYHARELGEFEQRWGAGDFEALAEGVKFCHVTGAPVPEWLAAAVITELHAAFHGFGPRERGMTQTAKAKARSRQVRKRRAVWAEHFLADRPGRLIDGKPMTRAQAFELAQEELKGTFARGTAEEIEKAYNVERRAERERLRKTP